MPFSPVVLDRERDKFLATADNETAVRVVGGSAMMAPALADSISFAYPDTTHDVLTFFQGGLAGTLLKTLTITYTDATKANILSVEWV